MVRINLAEFSIDTNSLDKAIVDNRSKIDALREALNNAKKANKDYSKEMQALSVLIVGQNKLQDELNRQLIANEISQEDYNASLLESNTIINQSNQRLSELSNLRRAEITDITDLERQIRTLSNENRSLERTYAGLTLAQSDLLENYDREGKSKQQLIEDNKRLRTIRDQLRLTTGEESAEVQRLNAIIDGNTNLINENADANETRIAGIGQYKEQIKSAFDDILNGNINQGFTSLQDSAKGLAVSIGNMTKQAWAFVATPIGAVVTAVVGSAVAIGALVKETFDYNKAIQENLILTEQLTGKTGDAVNDIRVRAEALTQTFGGDFKENLEVAKSLVTDFGISYNEAFELFEDGLIRGGNANNEFRESIIEYGPLIKDAGYSVKQFLGILNAGFDLGIYKDKLPDALKEANLALNEQTKATRDALVNAFGSPFSDTILEQVRKGEITTSEALQRIAEKSKELNLNNQQLAQLTADVFKGAGEDSGGTLKVFLALNKAQEDQKKGYNNIQKAVAEVRYANFELAQAKSDALKSDDVIALQQAFNNAWKKIQTYWYKGLSVAREYYFGVEEFQLKFVNGFINIFKSIPRIAGISFSAVADSFRAVVGIIINGGRAITKAIAGDFDGASKEFGNFKNNVAGLGSEIEKNASKVTGAVGKIIKDSNSQIDKGLAKRKERLLAQSDEEERLRKLEEDRNKRPLAKDNIIPPKEKKEKEKKDDADKKLEEAQKKELELAKNLADEQIKLANAELQNYILNNASKLTDSKRLNKALIDEENKRLDTLKDKNDKINFDEYNNKKKLIELSKDDESLKAEQLLVLTKEYENKKLEISQSTDKQKKDNSLKLETQTVEDKKLIQAIEFEQQLARLEELGASEFEIQQSKLEQEKQLELQKLSETLQEKFQLKLDTDANNNITQQEIDDAKIELKKELDAENDLFEQERIKAQLDAINLLEVDYANKKLEIENIVNENKLQGRLQVLRGLSQIAGQETALGKAIATASVAYEQYKSISSIISNLGIANAKAVSASPLTFGQPWVGVNTVKAGIDIGASVAGGVKAIADINGASAISNIAGGVSTVIGGVKKIQGFADGGLINDGTSISRANGDDVLITAKKGEVILNENQQSLLGGANTFSRIGVPGFATGGLIGASNLQSVQSSISNNQNVAEVSENAILQITDAIYQGSQVGIRDLNADLQISQGANF